MSNTIVFSQLKSYASNVRDDLNRMKMEFGQEGDKKMQCAHILTNHDEFFIQELNKRVKSISSHIQVMEDQVLGPLDTRLSHVTMEEVSTYEIFMDYCVI